MIVDRTTVSYRTTRSVAGETSFRDALLKGLAPDGGLYVPASIPQIPRELWSDADGIAEIGARVLPSWIGHLDEDVVGDVASDALNFPVPLVPLSGSLRGIHLLELFHGPTLSFKDFGARTMARLMSRFISDRTDPLTILVATSGDTGSAVADGFAGLPNIRVVLLYPKGQVSPTQERQLIVKRPGVTALAVRGTFDDCQRMVKEAFADASLRDYRLSSANSINIGRLLPQMLYYLEANRAGKFYEPIFCVPSGNLGNLTGGVLAHLSGMPAAQFIAAHNVNDFFPRHLADGTDEFRASIRTYSNAMDVGVPSNFERLRALLTPEGLRNLIRGESVSDEETLQSMRRVYAETGYLADPHTAVGLEAARRYRDETDDRRPIIVLSTAHPAKFPEIVELALGIRPDEPEALAGLREREVEVRDVEPDLSELRSAIEATS